MNSMMNSQAIKGEKSKSKKDYPTYLAPGTSPFPASIMVLLARVDIL
jgi:hypothetical protein